MRLKTIIAPCVVCAFVLGCVYGKVSEIPRLQKCLSEMRIHDESCFSSDAKIVASGKSFPLSGLGDDLEASKRMLDGTYMPDRDELSVGLLGGVAWTSEGELDYRLKLERTSPFQYRIIEISEVVPNDPVFRKAFLGSFR